MMAQASRQRPTENRVSAPEKKCWGSLLALGVSSVSVQLIMIREIMSSFSGNELVIGLVLGAWLLFTGLGSAAGARWPGRIKPERVLFWGHILIATLPFAQIAMIRAMPLLWVRGEMLGLTPAVLLGVFIVFPYCLVGGAIIPVAGRLLEKQEAARKVYVADTLGDIAGGLLFSLVLVYLVSHWESLIGLGLVNLLAAAFVAGRAVLPVLVLLAVAMVASRPLDQRSLSWRFPGQTIVAHKNTPFAQLTISRTGRQINVFQDAIPLYATDDLAVEAKAHLPLCQVHQGANVLLIAGGVFGTIDEMAKHTPQRIDYVELDPAVLELDDEIGKSLDRPTVQLHVGDGRLFVKQADMKYDAVVVDLPGPENAQLNRFYSLEFFHETKRILNPGGVFSFSLVGADNYLEEKGLAVNRSVHTTLKKAFQNVLVFPGQTHYYLASDGPLTEQVAPILDQRGIATRQLADYDLPSMSDPFRVDLLARLLQEKEVPANRDLSPVAFGHFMEMWLKKSGSSKIVLYALLAAAIGFASLAGRKDLASLTVMTSGYGAMAVELSLILLFQTLYGYVYLKLCFFVTLFMIGSALGALAAGKKVRRTRQRMIATDSALVLLSCAAAGLCFSAVGWTSGAALAVTQVAILPGLIVTTAFAVGYQFATASRAVRGTGPQIIGQLYLADLAGAAAGTILTGLVFVPRIGIIGVLISVAVLKALSLSLNAGWGHKTR